MKKIKSLFSLAFVLTMSLAASLLISGFVVSAIGTPEALMPLTAVLTIASAFVTAPNVAFGAAVPFTTGLCVAIQESLNNILGGKSPSFKRTQVGYLQAITSPQNTAGVTMIPIPTNGKNRKVRITYIQRGTASDLSSVEESDCEAEVFPQPLEDEIEVTKMLRTKWFGFNEDDMRKICQADSDFRGEVMNSKIDAFMVELNKKLIALQAANFGEFNPNIAYGLPKDVALINSAGTAMNYIGEAQMEAAFQAIDATEKPIVIGAGNLNLYAKMAQIGCCNDLGQNLSGAGNMDFFYDRFVDSILGANHFIGLVPGYVQLLTWNKYVDSYRKSVPNQYVHDTIVDPFTGIKLDMKWKYDDCDEQYKVMLKLYYDLWFIPTDSFKAGDELEGVNFTLHFKATQAS